MNQPLLVLASETSSPMGSIALLRKSRPNASTEILFHKQWLKERSHSEMITLKTIESLNECGVSLEQLSGLAVGVGPGSFTGVRVAINFIRSLGYSLNIPITSLSSLLALAGPYLHPGEAPVLSMVNAYKNLLYVAAYQRTKEGKVQTLLEPQALTATVIESKINKPHLVVGDGWPVFANQFSPAFSQRNQILSEPTLYPLAKDLGALSLDMGCLAQTSDWSQVRPLYIRASEAEEKLKVGLLKPLPEL
ncbi:MAG: tRNA (adenosine(37)-N6)-threonylcarbamoyltransferase complex dimerization subunit type 1 TsaB [Bdellovibrionales bacterium]|nr:tRNA (adenosine(37)-N6)-threonylcarbamoyltransferase complex dimerization subunit type 1 TsaB [Bdellovibrionales bacterium]